MSVLVIERLAVGASFQDAKGRLGWRRFGVSTAGAMDRQALAVANVLVGNPPGMAALETALAGGRFLVEERPLLVAVAGPGVSLTLDDRPVPPGQSVLVAPGQRLTMSAPRDGVHGYLAVAGGFDLTEDMGSVSGHLRSGIGAPMPQVGDRLTVRGGLSVPQRLAAVPETTQGPIRVMAGPQDEWFGADALSILTETEWQIGARADRMGRFLEGALIPPQAGSMVSDGVLAGSIQVPPSGQPVVLMRDCQTTGGYPKLATVISADLDRLAQMTSGRRFRLALVDRAQAIEAARALARTLDSLRPMPLGGVDLARLAEANLISGVVDAFADPYTC